ncbi:MAG: YceI family protein [Cyclobacteriaceae bacterium]
MKKLIYALTLTVFANTSFAAGETKEKYTVDTNASEVKWTGYHLAKSYEHWGTVNLKSGNLELEGDKIVGGEFVVDMNSITNGDIQDDPKDKAKLEKHLKSDDFFNAKKFPESTLKIKSATKTGSKYDITADLTIRGITKEIKFDATGNSAGDSYTFDAVVKIDRTAHEVMYGWKVENAILSDEFKLDIKLVAKK